MLAWTQVLFAITVLPMYVTNTVIIDLLPGAERP